MVRLLVLAILFVVHLQTQAIAQSGAVSYQGQLTNASGAAVSGPHRFEFRIYASQTGGAPVWAEIFDAVDVDRGLFTLRLGTQDPEGFAAALQSGAELWLAIRVNDGAEMMPRQPITSVTSAIHSDRAITLDAQALTGSMVKDASIGLDKLALVCQPGDTLVMSPTGWSCGRKGCVPTVESCDGIDNDCDGSVDEDYPDLGTACSSGLGACTRFGQRVCAANGSGSTCAAVAGAPGNETCDSLDNDCNGIVDDGFRNPSSGVYDSVLACGSCVKDCTAIEFANGVPACVNSSCSWSCSAGSANLNGASFDGCECTVQPGPDTVGDGVDQNCDGADGDFSNSILVDGSDGMDAPGCGSMATPCRAIAYGIARAQATGRANVLIAAGLYSESFNLVPGISLFGSYLPNFIGRSSVPLSIVAAPPGAAAGAVRCNNLSGAADSVRVEGFEIIAADAASASGSTYAVYARSCGNAFSLRHNWLRAGRSADGAGGSTTAPGVAGSAGAAGAPSFDTQHRCTVQDQQSAGAGGTGTCSLPTTGGAGGARICPAVAGGVTVLPAASEAGQTGMNSGGAGGAAGRNLYVRSGQCGIAQVFGPVDGVEGSDGPAGSEGAAGAGCAVPQGSVASGVWLPGSASSGGAGAHGGGGGGGGSGAGAFVDMSCFGTSSAGDVMGATGGGGGAGGCGGAGGNAGTSAGSSFAVFIAFDAPPVTTPTLSDNVIYIGRGGTGGAGGIGSSGGTGGSGGVAGSNALFAAGSAADGGSGGRGGAGGGGGGGCGGSAWGVYVHGAPGPSVYKTGNAFVPGTAGTGGQGGTSIGSPGGAGADGASADANY